MYIIVIFFMLFGILSEFKFCEKKISMTLLSVIMIVICSIQNSDGPNMISELLFLSQEAAGPKTSCLLRELGLRSWDHQLLIVRTLEGSSSTWHQWRRSGITGLKQHKTRAHKESTSEAGAHTGREVTSSQPVSCHVTAPNWCCEICGGGPYKGPSGLTQHMRLTHPDEHHAAQTSRVARTNLRWSQEEIALVAKVLPTVQGGSQREVNVELAKLFPHRTVESFKGLRKNPKFKQLLERSDETETIVLDEGDGDHLMAGNKSRLLAKEPHVELQRMTSESIRQFVEQEGKQWLSTLPKEDKPPSRKPRKIPAPPKTKKALRRHQYARMQTLFKKDRARAARAAIDGSWETIGCDAGIKDTTGFLDARQALVETEGDTVDIDSISGKGWISPISEEEVLTQLSQLSDTVAGQDRIPRKTMRELNPKTLVTHFNLYLKAESLPEALLEGRTVFVPEEEGT